MDILVPTTLGNERPAWAANIADRMLAFSKKYGLWGTLEFIVETWLRRHPEEYREFKQYLRRQKENTQDEFGSNERTRHGAMRLRRISEIPSEIVIVMEVLFRDEIENYPQGKREFYREFARRFPIFNVAGKI